MMKKFLASLFMLGSLSAMSQQEIDFYDIHNVITKTGFKNVKEFVNEIPNKDKILREFLSAPRLFYSTWRSACKQTNVAEERFEIFVENFPTLADAREAFYKVSNGSLNHEMVTILQERKKQGHVVYAATNSGPKTYAALLKRYPELNSLFEGVIRPDNVPGKFSKPHEDYFKHMQSKAQEVAPGARINFIDDSLKNVQGARSVLSQQDRVFQFKSASMLRNQLIGLSALAQ